MAMSLDFHAITVPLSDGTSFVIIHNLPLDGTGNIDELLDEWVTITRQFSAESFCLYIFEKRQQGLIDRIAMTRPQFEKNFQVKFEEYFGDAA